MARRGRQRAKDGGSGGRGGLTSKRGEIGERLARVWRILARISAVVARAKSLSATFFFLPSYFLVALPIPCLTFLHFLLDLRRLLVLLHAAGQSAVPEGGSADLLLVEPLSHFPSCPQLALSLSLLLAHLSSSGSKECLPDPNTPPIIQRMKSSKAPRAHRMLRWTGWELLAAAALVVAAAAAAVALRPPSSGRTAQLPLSPLEFGQTLFLMPDLPALHLSQPVDSTFFDVTIYSI